MQECIWIPRKKISEKIIFSLKSRWAPCPRISAAYSALHSEDLSYNYRHAFDEKSMFFDTKNLVKMTIQRYNGK